MVSLTLAEGRRMSDLIGSVVRRPPCWAELSPYDMAALGRCWTWSTPLGLSCSR